MFATILTLCVNIIIAFGVQIYCGFYTIGYDLKLNFHGETMVADEMNTENRY